MGKISGKQISKDEVKADVDDDLLTKKTLDTPVFSKNQEVARRKLDSSVWEVSKHCLASVITLFQDFLLPPQAAQAECNERRLLEETHRKPGYIDFRIRLNLGFS